MMGMHRSAELGHKIEFKCRENQLHQSLKDDIDELLSDIKKAEEELSGGRV